MLEQHVDHTLGQVRQHLEDRREGGDRARVATQAQQQQVARPVRVEGGLGVEHQLHLRRRAHLPIGVGLGRHQVLHEVATVLGKVPHRLAESACGGQQHELAHVVLEGGCRGRRGSGGQFAEGKASYHDGAGLGCSVGELDERVVQSGRHGARSASCSAHERLVADREVGDDQIGPRLGVDDGGHHVLGECGHGHSDRVEWVFQW